MPFVNRTSSGSAILQARVAYPAYNGGANAPLWPRAGGWPVVVFLHGAGTLGSIYDQIKDPLVAAGYIVVLSDTAQSNSTLQMQDGTALYPTLVAENLDPASPFYGALDMKRAALHGYSMGAGNTLRILAANPGYSAGFVHAPTSSAATAAPNIKVPFASVHGQGDTTASPNNSINLFNNSSNFTGTKTVYLFNTEVDHSNIISDALHRPPDAAVWARVRSIFLGFYECYLHGNPAGLEDVVGSNARTEPRLATLSHGVRSPMLWLTTSGKLGTNLRINYDGEVGSAYTMISAQQNQIATPFGSLLLDPPTLLLLDVPTISGTKLAVLDLQIPQDPTLLGGNLWLQSLAPTMTLGLRLSSAAGTTIVP